ncbi:MAG: class I SAM-dependent methyltransferase [Phycisphaeraceae bacterium]|nr:MAG: class I SAM-dependent methyltransferase [Phycisphaeraceae bacterium]
MSELSPSDRRGAFERLYELGAPWSTGEPQSAMMHCWNQPGQIGRVLDIGCGDGANAIHIASKGIKVVAIDFVPSVVECARARAFERGQDVTCLVMDATTLSGWSERFDAAIDVGMLHTLPVEAVGGYVSGVRHVLNSAGVLHLMCFSDAEEMPVRTKYSRSRLLEIFQDGWLVEHIAECCFDVLVSGRLTSGPRAWYARIRKHESHSDPA